MVCIADPDKKNLLKKYAFEIVPCSKLPIGKLFSLEKLNFMLSALYSDDQIMVIFDRNIAPLICL